MTDADAPPAGPATSARRASALVAAGILLSRSVGLLRERVIAHFLGLGVANDAFRAAVRIPNLLQNLLGEGVLSAAFIPVYARLLDDGDEEEAGRVAGAIAGLLALVAGALVLLGVVFARPLTTILAPGFVGDRELLVTLTRILTPGAGILVLSAWCLGVLNSHRRFFLSYVAPVLWNVAQITALVAAGAWTRDPGDLATALAWGAFAGGVAQFAVQVPTVRRLVPRLRLSARADGPVVRDVVRRFGPVVLGRGAVQLTAYVDLALASLLGAGSMAALSAAQVFALLPVSLFGMSVAAAELPELSRAAGAGRALVRARLEDGLARIAFFVVPSVVAYLVLGDLVVGVLLQTGRFDAEATRLVWLVLAGASVGLLATTTSRLLQNTLYAAGDTRTPARLAVLRVLVAGLLGYALMVQLDRVVLVDGGFRLTGDLPALSPLPAAARQADRFRLGAVGLTLASGVAAWVEVALLRRAAVPLVGRIRPGGGTLGRVAAAGAGAGAVAVAARLVVDPLPILPAAALALGATGATYLALAVALRVPEAVALLGLLRRRLRR